MNMQLDNWQKEILKHKGNVLLCTGRQVGKTTIFAIKAAEYMISHKNSKIIAVSLTEDQAFLMRTMVEDYIKANYKAYLNVPKKDKPTKSKIILNNGSTYTVRPVGNTGDALRGFTGDVLIVDEAAFMPELLWQAAKPTLLTTGGQIWLCSTPHVKEGLFFEQFEAARNETSDRFRLWHISSEKVIYERPLSDHWTEEKRKLAIKYLEEEKASMSKSKYGQEYLGLFMDDLQRWFSDAWIDKVCTIKDSEKALTDRDYYLGVDIARMGGDETTYEIIRKVSRDSMLHVHHEAEKFKLTTHTLDRIKQLDRIYNMQKIYIDAGSGSLGVGIFDQLLNNEQTKRKVIAINNRQILLGRETLDGKKPGKQRLLKEDLYDNLRMLGEQRKIKLLDNDKVRLSLRSIIFEVITSSDGRSKLRISGNYSHIAEGLIRAAYSSKEKNIKSFISTIKI